MNITSRAAAVALSSVLVGSTCALAWQAMTPAPAQENAAMATVPAVGDSGVTDGTAPLPLVSDPVATSLVPEASVAPALTPDTSTGATFATWPPPTPMGTLPSWPQPVATQPVVLQPVSTQPPSTQPSSTQPPSTQPPSTRPVVTSPSPTTTVARPPATTVAPPPVTVASPTTTVLKRYSVTGVPVPSSFSIPRSWTKPIPDWPAGCVAGQLEDNGVWNCQR